MLLSDCVVVAMFDVDAFWLDSLEALLKVLLSDFVVLSDCVVVAMFVVDAFLLASLEASLTALLFDLVVYDSRALRVLRND
jgi:hypothetical protein